MTGEFLIKGISSSSFLWFLGSQFPALLWNDGVGSQAQLSSVQANLFHSSLSLQPSCPFPTNPAASPSSLLEILPLRNEES